MIRTLINNPILFILMLPCVLAALTVHEYAHGYAAKKLGDDTAESFGRLTLNPLKHINPLGFLSMFFFGFGWATPVPINPRNFKNPRKGMFITALAGPSINILMAIIGAFFYVLFSYIGFRFPEESKYYLFFYYFAYFSYLFHYINLSFALFNLIPISPLDGSRMLSIVLPAKANYWIHTHQKQITIFMIIWIFFGSYLTSGLLSISFISSSPILSIIAQVFSFSTWFSKIISFVSEKLIYLFTLIF